MNAPRWRSPLAAAPPRQRLLPFLERSERRIARLKRGIIVITLLKLALLLALVPAGRRLVASAVDVPARLAGWARDQIGLPPYRARIDREWARSRARGVADTERRIERMLAAAEPPTLRLLRAAGLEPPEAVIRWGNHDLTFLLSGRVFERDDTGRSYRLRPDTRAVWLAPMRVAGLDTGQLLVPDTPEVRSAAADARIGILEFSAQTTNALGFRGPMPDPDAALRVIVVGDSYMQGLLLGDDQTPPAALERALGRRLGLRVAVLNTGLLGYSPEQYYHTLRAAVAVFPADFVVVTAFANDVGNEDRALRGEGDWAEAGHWLQELQQLCRQRRLPYLVTAVVCEEQFVGRRRGVGYPASLVEAALVPTQSYLDPIETFLNHDLAARGRLAAGSPSGRWQSPLFNQRLGDGHFSAEGAELWAEVVSERVVALLPNRFRSRTKETQASLPETSFQSGP